MEIRLYDTNKRLNHTSDHSTMKGCDVIEFHLNAYNGKANGTEILLKAGLYADALDIALLEIGAHYFVNRGFVSRVDLYNMNLFAKLGISYRLIECCFIDNVTDMSVFDDRFDMYATELAKKIRENYTKPVVLVAGHGAGDPGACANGREEATEVRRLANLIFEKLNAEPQPSPEPTPPPTPEPNDNIEVGDTIQIVAPYGRYIADDVATHFGMVQIRENALAGGENAFDWEDNGIPEECVDLTDNDGNKLDDSDITHPRAGNYFVFNTNFVVVNSQNVGEKRYLKLDFNSNLAYRFWVIEERCQKV